MTQNRLTCIICPMGCNIEAEFSNGKLINIKGNLCKRGKEYLINELTNPVRTITTTIRISNGNMLPVKTDKPVPKEKVFDCIKAINQKTISLPINIGNVIIKNIEGTGANVVSTKNMR